MYNNILFIIIFILILLIILGLDKNNKIKFTNIYEENEEMEEENIDVEEEEEDNILESKTTETNEPTDSGDKEGILKYKKFLKSFSDNKYQVEPGIAYRENCLICLNSDNKHLCKHNPMNLNMEDYNLDKRMDVPDSLSWPDNGIGRKLMDTDEVLFYDREYIPSSFPVLLGSTYPDNQSPDLSNNVTT